MSNLGNPNCCCEVGLHYPWLTFETNTFGANGDAEHPNQIVRTPVVTVSDTTPDHQYRYCNFILPSGDGIDDCHGTPKACYFMPTIEDKSTEDLPVRLEVKDDGCWGKCKNTLCWCDIPKDSTALKHYIDLDYPDVLNWVSQGPLEGGAGSNNAYPVNAIVMYNGIRYMAIAMDDEVIPRQPPASRPDHWAARTPVLTRHDSVHTHGLRAEEGSYAWHLTQDVRVPFNKENIYQSGERVYVQWSCAEGTNETPGGEYCFDYSSLLTDSNYSTSAPLSEYPYGLGGSIPDCVVDEDDQDWDLWDEDSEYYQGEYVYYKGRNWQWQLSTKYAMTTPDPTDYDNAGNYWRTTKFYCERFWLKETPYESVTGLVGPSLFDIGSGWEHDDPTLSTYTLNMIDWSQPEAWITGEQCERVAYKALSQTLAHNPKKSSIGYRFDEEDSRGLGAGWSDLGLQESYMAGSAALGFPYQGNRVFLHHTLARRFGTETSRGWGRQHRVVAFNAGGYIDCDGMGDMRENIWLTNMGGDEKVQTISADDSKYAFFKVELQSSLTYNSLADASVFKNEVADDAVCGKAAICHVGVWAGATESPLDEDYNRYKVYLQEWTRDGESITYKQADYPDCRYNFALNYNPADGCEELYKGSRQDNDSRCPRVADIVYLPEEWQIPNTKKIGSRGWKAMSSSCTSTPVTDLTEMYGLTKLQTYSQPYAIAPRVPMRGISIQNERWVNTFTDGSWKELDGGGETFEARFVPPSRCIITYWSCGGGYVNPTCKIQGELLSSPVPITYPTYVGNEAGYFRKMFRAQGADERQGTAQGGGGLDPFGEGNGTSWTYWGGYSSTMYLPNYAGCDWENKTYVGPWNGLGGLEDYFSTKMGGPYYCNSFMHTEHSRTQQKGWNFYNYDGKKTIGDLCRPCGQKLDTFTIAGHFELQGDQNTLRNRHIKQQTLIDSCNQYWYGMNGYNSCVEWEPAPCMQWNNDGNCIQFNYEVAPGCRKPRCLVVNGEEVEAECVQTDADGDCITYQCPRRVDPGGEERETSLPQLPSYNIYADMEATSYGQACYTEAGRPDGNLQSKTLAQRCGLCIDLEEAVGDSLGYDLGHEVGPQRGAINPPAWSISHKDHVSDTNDFSTPQRDMSFSQVPGACAVKRLKKACTETANRTHKFEVVTRLVAGTAQVGDVANEGPSKGSQNKRFVLKDADVKNNRLFEREFDWTTRVYNWPNQPNHGISLYGYDAGKFGSSTVDMVAFTTTEATEVEYDYYADQTPYLPRGAGWGDNPGCGIKNWACECTQNGGSYGAQKKFFQKNELWNRLVISNSDNPAYQYEEQVRHPYECSGKYEIGDVVTYSGFFWEAIGAGVPATMPNPFEKVDDGSPHFFDCTQIYQKGDVVCHPELDDAGNYYQYTFNEDTTDQGAKAFDCTQMYDINIFPRALVCHPISEGSDQYYRYYLKETTANPNGLFADPHVCTNQYDIATKVSGVDGYVWECVLAVDETTLSNCGGCCQLPSGIPTFDGEKDYLGGETWSSSKTYGLYDQIRTKGEANDGLWAYSGVFESLIASNLNVVPGTDNDKWRRLGDISEVLYFDGSTHCKYEANKNVMWDDSRCTVDGEPNQSCCGPMVRNPEPLIDWIRRGGTSSSYKFWLQQCSFRSEDWDKTTCVNWKRIGFADGGAHCSDGCCTFQEDNWEIVTEDDGSTPKVYNCCGYDTCCEFDYTQWDQGDLCDQCPDDCCPFDPNLWMQQESCELVKGIEEHWYNAYYHRDANSSEHSADYYDPSTTYNLGDAVKHSGMEQGWLVDRFFTYQATGSFDPIGEFNPKFWVEGMTDGSPSTSAAPSFDDAEYPTMYNYSQYDRVVHNNILYEAYPFYCTNLDFNKNATYGHETMIQDPQPMVVADRNGKIRSDPDHEKLYMWILNPTVEFVLKTSDAGLKCWTLSKQDDWCWKPGDSFPGTKWTKLTSATDEFVVRPPVDANKLRLQYYSSRLIAGRDYGDNRFNQNADLGNFSIADGGYVKSAESSLDPNTSREGGQWYGGAIVWLQKVEEMDAEDGMCCTPIDPESICQRTHDGKGWLIGPQYNEDGSVNVERFGVQANKRRYGNYCDMNPNRAFLNPNFAAIGNCLLGGEGYKDDFGGQYVPNAMQCKTFEREHWREITQPEFFSKSNRKTFHPKAEELTGFANRCDAAFPPAVNDGFYNRCPLTTSNDIEQLGVVQDVMCPAIHVLTESEGGGNLAAATRWNSIIDYGDIERSGRGQQLSYTYLELTTDAEGNESWDTYEINKDRYVVSWNLSWYDTTKTQGQEITLARSPDSLYSLNEAFNMVNNRCDLNHPSSYSAEDEPCWGYIEKEYGVEEGSRYWSPNDFQYETDVEDKNRLKQSSWRPWMEWSSDRWLFLHNFPMTTRALQKDARAQLSTSVNSVDFLAMTGTDWPEIEKHYPSYVPPATETYDKNKLAGYQYTGVLPGAIYTGTPSDPGIQPKPFRVIHEGLDYTVTATSEVAADTWKNTGPGLSDNTYPDDGVELTNNAYPVGSIVQLDGLLYRAIDLNMDSTPRSEPKDDTGNWEVVDDCKNATEGLSTYDTERVYSKNSLVKHTYNGSITGFRALEDIGHPAERWNPAGSIKRNGVGTHNAYPVGTKVYTQGEINKPTNCLKAVVLDDTPAPRMQDADGNPQLIRKTYPDWGINGNGQWLNTGPPTTQGPTEYHHLGVGDNNAYPIGTQVLYNGYYWVAVNHIDDSPTPRTASDGSAELSSDFWDLLIADKIWEYDVSFAQDTIVQYSVDGDPENLYPSFYKAKQQAQNKLITNTDYWELLTLGSDELKDLRLPISNAGNPNQGGPDRTLWESCTVNTAGAFDLAKWEPLFGQGCTVAGKFNEDNWVQIDNDGYLWRDWMVSHAVGTAGQVWIPVGCRVKDTGDEEKMIATNNVPANILVNNTHSTIQGSGCSEDFKWDGGHVKSCVFAGQSWGYRNIPAINLGTEQGWTRPYSILDHDDPSNRHRFDALPRSRTYKVEVPLMPPSKDHSPKRT